MEVSRYTVGCSIVFPQTEIAKFDAQLRILESKMKVAGDRMRGLFNLRLNTFSVDQRALDRILGNALDIASTRTQFRIERFTVDQNHLNNVMTIAMMRAMTTASEAARINPNLGRVTGRGSRGGAVAGGMIGGGLSRLFPVALAVGAGGYGLASLNKLNQRVVGAELQSQAVIQSHGGTAEEGKESFNWLRGLANKIGFSYLDAVQGYNSTLAGLIHTGMSTSAAQNVFKGFAEYGRSFKLDTAHQKRLFYAVSEVADMNELQKRQLNMIAIAAPGAKQVFAEAWQRKIGGNLTGQASEDVLLKAVKARQVKGDILPLAANIASERAAPGLAKAEQASQAEQGRYQNAVADLAKVASDAGVEEGFARIFRTLTSGLNESNDLVKGLAEGFNEATKWAEKLLLFPQSFVRALEGRDSLVADWLGADKTTQLQKDWKNIKSIFTDISSIHFDFLPTLESTAQEIAYIMSKIAEFQVWKQNLVASPTKEEDVSFWQRPITATYQQIGKLFNGTETAISNASERGAAVYDNPNSYFYQKPELYDDNQKNMALDMVSASSDYKLNSSGTVTNQFDITIHVDPATMGNMDIQQQAHDLMDRFRIELLNAAVQFPQKE